jgi:hypothetical protein
MLLVMCHNVTGSQRKDLVERSSSSRQQCKFELTTGFLQAPMWGPLLTHCFGRLFWQSGEKCVWFATCFWTWKNMSASVHTQATLVRIKGLKFMKFCHVTTHHRPRWLGPRQSVLATNQLQKIRLCSQFAVENQVV